MDGRREPWPPGWCGRPIRGLEQCKHRFPCIGEQCMARGSNWHAAGTSCLPFVDDNPMFDDAARYQRMCHSCVKSSEHTRWEQIINESGFGPSGAQTSTANSKTPVTHSSSSTSPKSKSAGPSKANTPKAKQQETTATVAKKGSCSAAGRARPAGADGQIGSRRECADPRMLTRHQEQRITRDTLWKRFFEPLVPGTNHLGKLTHKKNSMLELSRLHAEHPNLPVMEVRSSRALAETFLREQKHLLPLEKQAVVRDLFFIEAMRLCILLCAPEVIFFETPKCHAQYNVLDANNRTRNSESVKLCCPACRLNDFVLSTSAWRLPPPLPWRSIHHPCCVLQPMLCMAGEWNVNKPGCARFALSKEQAYAIVSKEYVCANPTCPRVEKKHEADSSKISKLCAYTEHGIQQSGRGHLKDLLSLGATFYGHEPGVLNMLPPEVRSTRSRKHRIHLAEAIDRIRIRYEGCTAASRLSRTPTRTVEGKGLSFKTTL